ncbi:hypothetical protein D3C78_1848810 [compost metagenome]
MRLSSKVYYNINILTYQLIHYFCICYICFNERMIGVTLDRFQVFQISSVSKCVYIDNFIIRVLL